MNMLDRPRLQLMNHGAGSFKVFPTMPTDGRCSYSQPLGLHLDLSKDEMDMTGWTFQWPESGLFFTGVEVYHSLHCLVLFLVSFDFSPGYGG